MLDRKLRARWLRGAAAAGALIMFAQAVPAYAQEQSYQFDIPAQAMGSALRAFARAARQQVTFDDAAVRGRQAPALRGSFTARAALDRLLDGSGLVAERGSSGLFIVRPGAAASGEGEAGGAAADSGSAEQDIVVTGSRIAANANSAVPVRLYTSETIAASGQPSVTAYLNTLPEVSQAAAPTSIAQFGGQTTVTLHGFAKGSTLIMIDGQRAPASAFSGGTVFDLNAIPMEAIERIDVVTEGSSAVYGSDAISGIVNIILKRDFSGVSVSAATSLAEDYSGTNLTLGLGRQGDRAGISVFGGYERADGVVLRDRSWYRDGDFSAFGQDGGAVRRTTNCFVGNVSSTSGGNLSGLGSPTAAIQPGVAGTPQLSQFRPGASNQCGTRSGSRIVTPVRRSFGMVSGRLDLAEHLRASGNLIYSRTESESATLDNRVNLTVPATNAFNPFGQSVRVATRLGVRSGNDIVTDLLQGHVSLEARLEGITLKAQVRRADAWEGISAYGTANMANLSAALASPNPATALNPFQDGRLIDPALAESLYPAIETDSHAAYTTGELSASGEIGGVFDLPIEYVVGAEVERQENDTATSSQVFSSARTIYAGFFEMELPFTAQNSSIGRVSANLSGRIDRYSDFGSHFTPRAALSWRPVSSLLLRASYSRAFRAPTPLALNFPSVVGLVTPIVDPQLGGASYNVPLSFGPNPDLDPERASSYSFGFTWTPLEGRLRLAVTRWQIRQDDRITFLAAQVAVDNPTLFPGAVTRNPATGAVTQIRTSYRNFGTLSARGVDLDLSYRFSLGDAQLTPRLSFSEIDHFESALTPRSPALNRLNRATSDDVWAPRWKVNASLDLAAGILSGRIGLRYVGSYLDYQTPVNGNRNGDFVLVDLAATVDLSSLTLEAPNSLAFSVTATNLFDRAPQYSNFLTGNYGYDPQIADALGRLIRLSIVKRF